MNVPTTLKPLLRRNVRLSQYTTMQIGGEADYFAEPKTFDELTQVLQFASEQKLKVFFLGKGSNVVFDDSGYRGLILSLMQFEKIRIDFDRESMQVTASAGVYLYTLVLACKKNGFGGCEFLASIPGTVGGAAVMNAGYSRIPGQKNEISDLITQVKILSKDGRVEKLERSQIDYGYRSSSLNGSLVLEVTLQLQEAEPESIEKEIRACFDYRNQKQDMQHPSSGSIFKNPAAPADPAAKIVDELGLKGTRIGGVQVSDIHGNYFINAGGGTAQDLRELIHKVQQQVFEARGIRLETEVRIISA